MDTASQHLLAEYWGCEAALLNNPVRLEVLLREAAAHTGTTVVGALQHRYTPQGSSVVLLLAESHCSIHTWPEAGYAAVDFFTCGAGSPLAAHTFLTEALGAERAEQQLLRRGTPPH